MKKIILITGSELRHDYFRLKISSSENIDVIRTYCESKKNSIENKIKLEQNKILRENHLNNRKKSEIEFFKEFCDNEIDESNPKYIIKGEINNSIIVEEIIKLNPDLIVSYGCSIIKSKLIDLYEGRFINIHLGLSPYYRGSGTNFFPFVNNELQFVGTTFMLIDKGIDTGRIIHQLRSDFKFDNIHDIGNNLIKKSIDELIKLIKIFNLSFLNTEDSINYNKSVRRYYGKKDFTEESVELANKNILNNSIDDYKKSSRVFEKKFPIKCYLEIDDFNE